VVAIALKDRLYVPTRILIGVLSLQLVTALAGWIFECRPISFIWNKDQPGTCFDRRVFVYCKRNSVILNFEFDNVLLTPTDNNVFTIITDVVLVVLPIPYLYKVYRSKWQNFGLIGIFAIALLSTVSR
jgi:hypothetical protein